ncbi:MAG: HEAT repeat domain-containing protein [Chloroflexi bacterium]|jgi:HEAT repeat protein|nr:HEAT repeat domain-containing protein [Chloroflexota bacterium]
MAIKFEDIIRDLTSDEVPITKGLVRRLSNLGEPERQALVRVWGGISVERRRQVLHEIAELSETEFDTDFSAVTYLALTDLHDDLREAAIEASWPDESVEMFNRLLSMASVDSSPAVRAAAVSALGRFILQAELGKFSPMQARQAERVALRLYNNRNEDVRVRCRALEAIANSSRAEVIGMIEESYRDGDSRLRAAALYAMGRTCDRRWASTVLRELNSDDPAIRFEALRAAGELGLEEAVPLIGELVTGADRQTLEMAIWALGEIGGGESQRVLEELFKHAEEIEDEGLIEQIEDALANASLPNL